MYEGSSQNNRLAGAHDPGAAAYSGAVYDPKRLRNPAAVCCHARRPGLRMEESVQSRVSRRAVYV